MRASALVVLLALLLGRHAHADDGSRSEAVARSWFERAEKQFAAEMYRDALRSYERAYAARPLPELLFNIAQCHRNLGNYRLAVTTFRRYLELEPGAANRESVEATVEALEEELRREEASRLAPVGVRRGGKEDRPLYRRGWFWAGVAAVAVAGTVAGAYLLGRDAEPPASDLGNTEFPR